MHPSFEQLAVATFDSKLLRIAALQPSLVRTTIDKIR